LAEQQQDRGQLDADIVDAFVTLFDQIANRMEAVAQRYALPGFCVKALHMLSSPMAMKDLSHKFHCDPSFVTTIADQLASRGLGKRETDSRDRRVKNLLLTPKGVELRERLESELFGSMPWSQTLDVSERECLLTLLRKMAGGARSAEGVTAATEPAAHSGS
jgi:DNA-binding MarR family transcriptional regulator